MENRQMEEASTQSQPNPFEGCSSEENQGAVEALTSLCMMPPLDTSQQHKATVAATVSTEVLQTSTASVSACTEMTSTSLEDREAKQDHGTQYNVNIEGSEETTVVVDAGSIPINAASTESITVSSSQLAAATSSATVLNALTTTAVTVDNQLTEVIVPTSQLLTTHTQSGTTLPLQVIMDDANGRQTLVSIDPSVMQTQLLPGGILVALASSQEIQPVNDLQHGVAIDAQSIISVESPDVSGRMKVDSSADHGSEDGSKLSDKAHKIQLSTASLVKASLEQHSIEEKLLGGSKRSDNEDLEKRKFQCSDCGKTFRRGFDMRRHQLVHSGERNYKCNKCSKTFSRNDNLLKHQRIHEEGIKPQALHLCESCSKSFTRLSDLRRHEMLHTGIKPFVCLICKKDFTRHDFLRDHLFVHTGEKPYGCKLCNKVFSSPNSARKHSIIHSDNRNFKCQHCKRKFTTLQTMARHIIDKHPEEELNLEELEEQYGALENGEANTTTKTQTTAEDNAKEEAC